MFWLYCKKGKDNPNSIGRPEFDTYSNMKMVVTMLQITRSICTPGKIVIMDIGFCELKGLL